MDSTRKSLSQASPRSHSDQSLILNQNLNQMQVFHQGLFDQSQTSHVESPHQNQSSVSLPETRRSGLKSENADTRESLTLQARLRERLYDKPENSGVMQFIHLQTLRNSQIPEHTKSDGCTELPTLLKRSTVSDQLPTNMPKKSYSSRLDQSKSPVRLSDPGVAAFQKIIRRKLPTQLTMLSLSQVQSNTSTGINKSEKLVSETGEKQREETASTSHTRIKLTEETKQQTNLPEAEDKVFEKRAGWNNEFGETISDGQGAVKQFIQREKSDVAEVPYSLMGRSQSADVSTEKSSRKAKLVVKSHSTSHVISKCEFKKEPSFQKRNRYDDTVPETIDAYEKLIDMRKKLGWVVEIPRHGPDTRKMMDKLKDVPDANENEGKHKEDSGEFFYCLPCNHGNPQMRYNPYDLCIVSANVALSEKMYFTISASYVTVFYDSDDKMNESNATSVLWWLWERRLFYKVFHFPVFVRFRLWKTFEQWRKIIRRQKNKGQQTKLHRSLFIANEVLQGCLIHVRGLCESARNVFKDGNTSSIISFVELNSTEPMTLQEFENHQKGRCDRALEQLNLLREKIIEIVWESCAAVAEMEGVTQGIRDDKDNRVYFRSPAVEGKLARCRKNRLKIRQTFRNKNMSKKEDVEKMEKPLYVEIAEWRKILARLTCFIQCVDYILQDLLRHLVFSAAEKLRNHLVTSYHAHFSEESNDENDDDFGGADKIYTPPTTSSSSRVSTKAGIRTDTSSPLVNKQNNKKAETPMETYVIPHYDFDQVMEAEKPPDVDKILNEIKRKDIVETVISPAFTVSLVLNVPLPTSSKTSGTVLEEATTKDAKAKSPFPADGVVAFSNGLGEMLLGHGSESEGEYKSGESELDDDDDDDNKETSEKSGKYAYPEVAKEDLAQDRNKSFVSLSPSALEFHSSIQSLICYFEDTVVKITPLLREPKLSVFYTAPVLDLHLLYDEEEAEKGKEVLSTWPDLDLILRDDPAYQRLLSDILNYMEKEMRLLKKFATSYDIFCQMVNQSRKINVEESLAKKPWTPDEFNQVLRTHTEMIRRMNKMTTSCRIAMVQVQGLGFQDSCQPYPQAVVDAAKKFLPIIANKQNDSLITIIKGASKLLDKTIISVEEFVEHLSFLGRMSLELPALEKELDVVNKLFAIASDYNIHFHPEQMALYQTLSPSFQHLKTSILYCEAKKDENIRKFSSQLNTIINNIHSTLTNLKSRVHDPELIHADAHALSALETIHLLQEEVQMLSIKARSYASYRDRFGSSLSVQKKNYYGDSLSSEQQSEYSIQEIQSDLSEAERDLNLRRLLWQSLEEWTKLVDTWTATAFDSIYVEELQKSVNKFSQTLFMLEKGLPHNEVVPRLKEKVLDFKQGMPVITSLRNPSLRQRHWEEIQKIINKTISQDKNFTLGNLLEMNIFKHKEKIQEIATAASNEATLEQMLHKVIDLWLNMDFRLVPHAERDTLIIYGTDDIMTQLEESQLTIGTIRGSRYVTPIKAQVEEWERKLQVFSRTLDEWLTCQRNWLYLEQIFSTPDIQRQLPVEYKLFMTVDKAWKDIMRRTADRPNALKSAITPGTLDTLQMCNANLEKIQRCLEDYLETKRFIFPRFYFLSNDELLDILAQSKDPNAVQPHLVKCFDNIKQLDICFLPRQPPSVRSMISSEREIVALPRNLRARGAVEQWLGTVEVAMFETIKKQLKLGIADRQSAELKDWVLKHPGQVVLTVVQIIFNKEVTRSFSSSESSMAMKETQKRMVDFLNQLASFTYATLEECRRMSIEALLTIAVHNRDITAELIKHKVEKKEDFEWNRQLRYEWDEATNNCQVQQSNATFQYGCEYLGCSSRLVITPLTDRCYLTLTGALHLHLGGSPAGPAGTGKTETVKDLAKAMGKQCVVFNCSEGLDYKMLGRLFSGLAQSGSWCCFDEFNRIDIEVLSVVAMQIHAIKLAKDAQAARFLFEGRDIKLNPTCGYFITMNPTYAGRVELPDNLKYLFRPVAMMVPDYTLIAEIMLFSEGFTAAKSLSQKIVNLYQLASKQLSQQDHYDFGMRAIKSVLVMAGHRRRSDLQKLPLDSREITENDESFILIHSLRDANMPKFLAEDVPLFESILDDLFPGVTPPVQDHGALEKAISLSIRDLNMQHWPSQVEKVKQLYNQILVRHGVMLVGPTGGGKTSIRNILQKALVLLPTLQPHSGGDQEPKDGNEIKHSVVQTSKVKKGHIETFIINPKCVTLGELYGETDPNTFEWSDGLIANATRKFSKDLSSPVQIISTDEDMKRGSAKRGSLSHKDIHKETDPASHGSIHIDGHKEDENSKEGSTITEWRWLILDGPVDTLWVENLNTVLDDSKVLCLASGERISLSDGMRLLFEVDNLAKASPATVSRCAMVYMDPVDLGWKPYVKTWLNLLPKEFPQSGKNLLQALFDASVDKGLNFLRKYKEHQAVQAPDLSIISTLCNILSAYIDFIGSHGGFGSSDEKEKGTSVNISSSDNQTKSGVVSGSKTKQQSSRKSPRINADEETSGYFRESQSQSKNEKMFFLEKHPLQLTNLLGKLFVFAYTWSIGGVFKRREFMEEDDSNIKRAGSVVERMDINNEFDNFARELFEVEPPLGVRLPTGNRSIYGYFVDMEGGSFVPWDVLIPSTKSLIEKGVMITIGETLGMASDKKKQEIKEAEIIPTIDIVRFSFLISLLLVRKHPVLLTGESGVGKTAIISYMLKGLEKEGGTSVEKSSTVLGAVLQYSEKRSGLLDDISNLTSFHHSSDDDNMSMEMLLGSKSKHTGLLSTMIQCSAQTTSKRLEAQIMLKLIKKGRTSMGAPKGKKVIVFVDDMSMPAPEEYGAQPPLELLRQYLEMGGFYDTKKLIWKDIQDVTLVATCGPPGGGRNLTTPRLLKHFSLFTLPQPSTKSLQHIYQVQLGRFLQEGEFMPEVQDCLFPLVSASIALYYNMCAVMLPTPAKSHYTFNIRDLSKVIQGMLQVHESVIIGKENCAQLFAHEATRVFHDRLTNQNDRQTFFHILADNLHDYFRIRRTPVKLMAESVLFGDFFDSADPGSQSRIYRPLSDENKLVRVLEEYHMRMNMGDTTEQLVFFKDAVEHLVRAARVFRQPGGHLLLVGLDGTGKSTMIRLASYIGNCEIFQLKLHNQYGIEEFRDDLKTLYLQTGVKGIPTVFLLTDSDIVKEAFLEDINSILNSGEVPDLFDNEELDGITMDLNGTARDAGVTDTKASIYGFFIQRIRQKLHIVLTMSPAGDKFRQRCRMNPALINCCTIDWFDEWTDEAMLRVARAFFSNTEFIADESHYDLEELKERTAQICVNIHKSVSDMSHKFWEETRRRYYSTPGSYMELIRLYSRMLRDNKQEFINNRDRLQNGLTALSSAYAMVGVMQEDLVSLGPIIEAKAKDTELLLEQLEEDQQAVKDIEDIVSREEAIMAKETQIVQDYADECESDLRSVLPVLKSAIAALETLDKASISELRVYTKPPQLVATVVAAVCVLFQKKTDWATGKLFLGDPQFLKLLMNYDRNGQPDKVYAKLKKYTKDPSFNPEAVGKVSLACKCICSWVLAIDNYNTVHKMVQPKQKKVQDAREALKLAQDNLAKKQKSLKKIQDHLGIIQQQYQDSVNQREALKERQKVTALRLERASILINALADEEVRWSHSVKTLDMKLEGIVGDTLVAAASVAYMGAYTTQYRNCLVENWVAMCRDTDVPISNDFDFVKSLIEPNQVMKWYNNGLPRDRLSTENATFVSKARKWPLFIDPQGQAVRWIKEMEGVRLKIVTGADSNIMRTIETAIKVGDPCLLMDVGEELDPSLRPVLMQETFSKGGQQIMKIGDVELEYNKSFRLYITTSLANPHYLPGVYLQVNIINFTITLDGLQEQLLSSVVKQERPMLEKQRTELLESIANDRQTLRDLEDKTLSMLQNTEGHLLDDPTLLETLQQSKIKSQEIHKRVAQSEETEQNLNQARKRYLPVATRGSVIYFVLAELANLDVMYQYSLTWFQSMFTVCISESSPGNNINGNYYSSKNLASGVLRPASAKKIKSMHNDADDEESKVMRQFETESSQDLAKHLQGMIEHLTYTIYRIVSVGLFSHHQLIFSFLLCSNIMQANVKFEDDPNNMEGILDNEWHIFLHGNVAASLVVDNADNENNGEAVEGKQQQSDVIQEDSAAVLDNNKTTKMILMKQKVSYPTWITEPIWRQCQCLEATIPNFGLLCQSLSTGKQQWSEFKTSEDPFTLMEKTFLPEPNTDESIQIFEWTKLTKFQRLLLIKSLRLEVLPASMAHFIQDQLGPRFLSTGTFDLHEIYADSIAGSPLIFILSPGCDPSSQLQRFAKDLKGSALHLDVMSLGRGQGPKAEELISKAQILKGRWVFLQNCHLAASWMPRLQNIVEKFNQSNEEGLDPHFRLWLSSVPDPCFPVSILQSGIKMTIEAPRGLKANLLRTFGSSGAGVVTKALYDEGSSKLEWHPLLYGLCLFNSIIHERRKYGTLGWNIRYEFNDSDLEVSILKLQMLLEEQERVPWAALTYLTGEVTYGGRVTDDWDRRCLISLLGKFYTPALFQPGFFYDSNHRYPPVPENLDFNSVISFVKELPDNDSPEIFGMTESAEKACREYQAMDIINTVLSVQPRRSTNMSGSQKSSDTVILEVAGDITCRLPRCVEDSTQTPDPALMEPQRSLKSILQKDIETKGLDKEKLQVLEALTNDLAGNSAMFTVLRQEIDRFNHLLSVIHTSLSQLTLAVKGEVVMSEQLEDAYEALLSQRVPVQWKSASYESRKPLSSWVTDLQKRVEFFADWAKLASSSLEKKFRQIIRNMKEIEGFLTAVLQNHARKVSISVDSLTFRFEVMRQQQQLESGGECDTSGTSIAKKSAFSVAPPENGVLVHGLFLDGARWDPKIHSLQNCTTDERFCDLPNIHFEPVEHGTSSDGQLQDSSHLQVQQNDVSSTTQMYECPLYRTSARAGMLSSTGHSTNFVTFVILPSDQPPDFWILRGVAMLCQLDD